ncbi:MAG: ABC transporter ATP-binding protein [Candidatus Cloacimonetes bacterium]|nr:ABC transporter ATP-binding protein [Candidatus Cloacimonadota bacterium]
MPLLEARGLAKTYSEGGESIEVLRGAGLVVEAGDTLAIRGRSGSGKSTLLHMLGLLDLPDAGSVLYDGQPAPTNDRAASAFRNSQVGFVFQFHYLLDDFTAEENVAMPAILRSGKRQRSLAASRDLLGQVGLGDRLGHYPSQLSGGEQQRVALARALVNQPRVVLADEPTGNLDSEHSAEIISLLLDMNRTLGQTFIIVTHDESLAARMKRVMLLEGGVLRPVGD